MARKGEHDVDPNTGAIGVLLTGGGPFDRQGFGIGEWDRIAKERAAYADRPGGRRSALADYKTTGETTTHHGAIYKVARYRKAPQ